MMKQATPNLAHTVGIQRAPLTVSPLNGFEAVSSEFRHFNADAYDAHSHVWRLDARGGLIFHAQKIRLMASVHVLAVSRLGAWRLCFL